MSIKKTIKFNIYAVCFFLICILFANYYVLKKIESNNERKNSISELIFFQDDMNTLILDVLSSQSQLQLDRIKNKFKSSQMSFEKIKNNLTQHLEKDEYHVFDENLFIDMITEDFNKLLSHKSDGIVSFDTLYELQENRINFIKTLTEQSPLEIRFKNLIQDKILLAKDSNELIGLSLLQDAREKALFEYKEMKYFEEWKKEAISLSNTSNIPQFSAYIKIIDTLSDAIFELNEIKKMEWVFVQNIKNIRQNNKRLNRKINQNTEVLTQKLTTNLNYMLLVLILCILIIVILFGIKIYNNIGLSVDETNAKIEFEINENRKKDELLAHQSKLVAMGEMMGNIAHQWRQPLNALAGNIQFLKEDYEDGDINEKFLDKFIKENTKFSFINLVTQNAEFCTAKFPFCKFIKENLKFSFINLVTQNAEFCTAKFPFINL